MPTQEQLEFHYQLEKKLAARIMDALPEQRSRVSLEAYDELFSSVPWHPGHLATEARRREVEKSYRSFLRQIGRDRDVLEIGCGNGIQLRALAPVNKRCVGVDISATVLDHNADLPSNVELLVADACDLSSLADNSFDVAFSSQLIEHIHPDDVPRHLREMARVLRPGGRYIFNTPHRFTGPHDVSKHFDEVATCFHLKEYSFGELLTLMRAAGFRRFQAPQFRYNMYQKQPLIARLGEIPADLVRPLESLIGCLPRRLRKKAARAANLTSVYVVAWV